MPWHVDKSDRCPAAAPWAVIKEADSSIVACHETREDADAQLAALYANEPQERAGGQWQALYGDLAGRWWVLTGAIGAAPPAEINGLAYLGEPSELLHRLYAYRLAMATTGTIAKHTRRVLATELELPPATLLAYVHDGAPAVLSSRGWTNLVRAVLYMETGRSAHNGIMARL